MIRVKGYWPMRLKGNASWDKGHMHMGCWAEGYGTVPVGEGVRGSCVEGIDNMDNENVLALAPTRSDD
nr:hypothetical protein [Tanacetum cinerariifolium]